MVCCSGLARGRPAPPGGTVAAAPSSTSPPRTYPSILSQFNPLYGCHAMDLSICAGFGAMNSMIAEGPQLSCALGQICQVTSVYAVNATTLEPCCTTATDCSTRTANACIRKACPKGTRFDAGAKATCMSTNDCDLLHTATDHYSIILAACIPSSQTTKLVLPVTMCRRCVGRSL